MTEQNKLEQAKTAFATLCQTIEGHGWSYQKKEEELTVECTARGEDLPMDVVVKVDADRSVVRLFSHLPFIVAEDKRLDMAIAISAINYRLVSGNFDYGIESGHVFFRMTNSFIESQVSEEIIDVMLLGAFHVVDEFNDKLLMLAKGMISIEKFLEALD